VTTPTGMPTPEAARRQLEELTTLNQQAINELKQRGVEISGFDNVRLALFIDSILGGLDQLPRLAYEYRVQRRFAELIEQTRKSAIRHTLLDGVPLRGPVPR
jgi:hypothetical protein